MLRHVLGKIEHDGDVAALSGERGAAAAAEQGRAEFAAERNGGENVIGIAGKNDADGDLAVVGAVGGVEGAAADVEANFAANILAQSFGQARGDRSREDFGAGAESATLICALGRLILSDDYFLLTLADLNLCSVAAGLDVDGDRCSAGHVETMVQWF